MHKVIRDPQDKVIGLFKLDDISCVIETPRDDRIVTLIQFSSDIEDVHYDYPIDFIVKQLIN